MEQREWARLWAQTGRTPSFLGVKLSGDLRGLLFEACVEQRFCNQTDKNVEVVYSFPLPWGAVLLGVDVVLGGRPLTGAVVEKKQATADYEEALSEGNAAIMLEKNRDHSYSLNLGNLAAGEHCTITLRYAQTLRFEQSGLRLLIPTLIAPRYGDARQGGLMPHQVPHHSVTAESPFALELRLHGDLAKAQVASPSHPIAVVSAGAESGRVLTIALARQSWLDRDFVLAVGPLANRSLAVASKDAVAPDHIALLASFRPRTRTEVHTPTAVKILVDCSGSMAGDSIQAAKRALLVIVKMLGAGDRFSLSCFGSSVKHRARGLWKASEVSKRAAHRWVAALDADMGGTEMEAALESTFALAQTVPSDVLLVTDGEINAIDSTIDAARASGHRLFVVGIGSSPAETHLQRLAEATGGACDFLAPGEAVAPAVLRMFARLRSPRLSHLRLAWPDDLTPLWVSPMRSAVFDGDTVNVFALLPRAIVGDLRLLGLRDGDDTEKEIGCANFQGPLEEASDALSRMVASAWIQASVAASPHGIDSKTTQLAIDYQLVTDSTNFLLVHTRPEGEQALDMPAMHHVEQMMPAGWGGLGSVTGSDGSVDFAIPCIAGPSVWRSSRTQAMRRPKSMVDSGTDDLEIPDFLRNRWLRGIEDRENSRYWCRSEHYNGLTPLGLSEWLRVTSTAQWPATYEGLQHIGIGIWLLDWLELVMAPQWCATEAQVVGAFVHLMSWPEVHQTLAQSTKASGVFQAMEGRLHDLLIRVPSEMQQPPEATIVEALATALQGMRADTWPETVLDLEAA